MSVGVALAERGMVPDSVIRWGIRRNLAALLDPLYRQTDAERRASLERLMAQMRTSPIALATDKANAQHYEVPPEFFRLVLGPQRKYSGALWSDGVTSLGAAEDAMLALTCERAGLADGQAILELGCGWGSLTLFMAERYPQSRILALSNSHGQRETIEALCRERGLTNVRVVTGNVAEFDTPERFDRIVSVEMFEHMRNVEALLANIARWLVSGGRLFVHVFSHAAFAYTFDEDPQDWMGSRFFSGGMMPSHALYREFQRDLQLVQDWRIDGTHYARTLRAWLDRLDAQRDTVLRVLAGATGAADAPRRLQAWRLFLMGCEESFAFRGGHEWGVSHYVFAKR